MLVRDALYGCFELPKYVQALAEAPEFRRLAKVRLLNINSPSLSCLADASRYSHTLGVIRLALANPLLGLSSEEARAFIAAIIVHDAGSPAFAHLLEYFFRELFGWHHEAIIRDILTGSRVAPFKKICKTNRIDFDLVLNIIERKHPFSTLIFGSLDFDNIDNVARMSFLMGQKVEFGTLLSLSSDLGVDANGRLQLSERAKPSVEYWASLRTEAYNILVFDQATVAGQAVLSKMIQEAIDDGLIDQNDWIYNDNRLLEVLATSAKIKRQLNSDFEGRLPGCCLLFQTREHLTKLDSLGRAALVDHIELFLKERFGRRRVVYGYAFRDRGTFSKRIELVDPGTGATWWTGTKSDSYVLYGFVRGEPPDQAGVTNLGGEFYTWLVTRLGL